MDVADELCYELFHLIDQQERCADHLMALATELEGIREAVTKGHLVGNTATVLGSATLVVTGIATVVTGGLAAPILALAAGITAGAGTVTAVGLSFVQSWKSGAIMKNAEKTADQIKEIQDNIERLQKKLNKECENKLPKTSSSEELQCEFTARILRALAKRSGKDLSISRLKRLISSNDEYYRDSGTNPNIVQILFYSNFGIQYTLLGLFGLLGLVVMRPNMSTYSAEVFEIATTKMAIGATKTVLKGTGQVVGGVLGLMFAFPDLINNCEELIKNKHETEASTKLRDQATEIRETVRNLMQILQKLQEMLNQIHD